MLKELQEKKYPFPDVDLLRMFDDLLKKEITQLLNPKTPKEVERATNRKYYQYHSRVSHPLETVSYTHLTLPTNREV